MNGKEFIKEIMQLNEQTDLESWYPYYIRYLNGTVNYEQCKGYFIGIIDSAQYRRKIGIVKAEKLIDEMYEILHENHPFWANKVIHK